MTSQSKSEGRTAKRSADLEFSVNAEFFVQKIRKNAKRVKRTKNALRQAREVKRAELERVVTI